MAFSTVAKLGAGSKLFYETQETTPSYVALPNALSLGQVGEQGEFVETTPISETVREYIKGLQTPPNKQITFNDVPGNTAYADFLDLWDIADSINMKVEYSNGRTAEFVIIPSGRVMEEPQGNAQLQMIVFGQQSGGTEWSETGAV